MIDILLSLVLQILCQIDGFPIGSQIGVRKTLDPWRSGSWEQQELGKFLTLRSDSHQNFINILFEAHVEHGVGLIKNNALELIKFDVSPFDMVQDSAGGANENINSLSQLISLVVDVGTTIDCDDIKFFIMMLQIN